MPHRSSAASLQKHIRKFGVVATGSQAAGLRRNSSGAKCPSSLSSRHRIEARALSALWWLIPCDRVLQARTSGKQSR
ncbi:hypothetical protein WJX79_001297 [Trebouxia sp. C0005]